jgi:pimeloyl-ACP methyl ester carboxylesterase
MPIDVARLRAEYHGPHELVKTSDGRTLFVRRWNAKGEASASVLIFHGITAHSAPYGPIVAEQLCNSGYEVFGLDLRGHGLSDGRRGDYPSADRLKMDLTETTSFVKKISRKLVVMGHSLGVLAAIITVKSDPKDVDGLVLVSAAKRIRTGAYPKPSAGETLKTLFVAVGDHDELFPAEGVKEFCDSIDDCDDKEFHVIPGASHAVWPEGSFAPLVDWLEKRFRSRPGRFYSSRQG